MTKVINIDREKIFQHIKLSCQIPAVIEGIVNIEIIKRVVAEMGIKVELEELQSAADDFRLGNQLYTIEDTESWLEKNHLSVDDFEELVEINLLSNKLARYLFADRVEPFFYEHQLDYMAVAMYEVLLEDEDLAMELYYALHEGEISFQEVARQYIREPTLRRSGGYQGVLRRTELKPEISAAVFAATPPQILKPISTGKKIHLILVEEIIQPELDDRLRQRIMSDLFDDWIKKQVKQVELLVDRDNISQSVSEQQKTGSSLISSFAS